MNAASPFKKRANSSWESPSTVPSKTSSSAEKLEFPYEIIPNAEHFLASDGYREFPQLLDWLQMIIGGVEEVGDSNDSAQNQSR